ncbi:unnamed protein product [Didymodactylos carnosus]|uniref:G-protein coupled receptors family 1 profile domain-containing protein n=1 Tax=Didymodactylos carnosus TaxID=1234261 RepID=A0A814DVX9_9BILA|nr:unnamed protein product [Didymodactylos carnosus]CAF3735038.1 unnamed protein product [Didymodactylos carnosus]
MRGGASHVYTGSHTAQTYHTKHQSPIQIIEENLTSMLLLQIIATIMSSIPFGVQLMYSLITNDVSKDLLCLAWENLALQIARILFYTDYSCNFYIYLSTKIFRKQLCNIIKKCLFPTTCMIEDSRSTGRKLNVLKIQNRPDYIHTVTG